MSSLVFAPNNDDDGTLRGGVPLDYILGGKAKEYENRFKDLVVPVVLNCQQKRCTRDPLKIPKNAPVIDEATLAHMEDLTVGHKKPRFVTNSTRKQRTQDSM